ncbi:MAG: anaerobic sulfatase maturase [Promethearchaeota archaeon]
MKPFSLLIKPAGADCNLRCKYCFYIDHLREGEKAPRMSEDVLKALITSYMRTNQNNNYSFGWQGGEPTLMGLKFFKKVVELQKKFGSPGTSVSNGLQTNGTLITDEMARFFGEYKFLIGVSLDGPPELHNYYRKALGQKPTHVLVMRGIEHLRRNNVEFNILILVNDKTVQKASEIYHYFRKNGFFYQQYIPCVEYDGNGNLQKFAITGEQWGTFLCEIFDNWIKEDIYRVSIRLFDSILEYLIYGKYNVCYMGNNCCQYFVVEHDGGIYPCDFFVRDDLLLGNVKTGTWEEFSRSPIYNYFGRQKAEWNATCDSCPFINFCHGDCQKHRFGAPKTPRTLSTLCRGWKKFYAHALPYFETLAKKIRFERNIQSSNSIKLQKIGRNDPCPCGSGKKYKNCCMK